MPKGLTALDTGKALLDYVQGHQPEDSPTYPHVAVGAFEHSDMSIRGVSAIKRLHKDDVIISVPADQVMKVTDIKGRRFNGVPPNKTRLALWLAEKKAEFAAQSDVKDKFWSRALQTYPALDHFRSVGIPLAASDEDLQHLEGLPSLGRIPVWVREKREELARALDVYNAKPEGHTPLKWEDVLWGRIIGSAWTFGTDDDGRGDAVCGGTRLAPIADLVNHSLNSNAHFNCNGSGKLEIVADQNINPAEEITIVYKKNPLANLLFYGILDQPSPRNIREFFISAQDCSELKKVHLENSDAPLLQGASKFVEMWCPTPSTQIVDAPTQVVSAEPPSLESEQVARTADHEMIERKAFDGLVDIPEDGASVPMEEKTAEGVLEKPALPFTSDAVVAASMPPLLLPGEAPSQCRQKRSTVTHDEAKTFLHCQGWNSLDCHHISKVMAHTKQQSRRNCLGIFSLLAHDVIRS